MTVGNLYKIYPSDGAISFRVGMLIEKRSLLRNAMAVHVFHIDGAIVLIDPLEYTIKLLVGT